MQPTIVDVLILPVSLLLLGSIIYFVLWARGRHEGRTYAGRWIGAGVMALGLLAGLTSVWAMLNPSTGSFYQASLFGGGKKLFYAHYVAPILPLAGLITVAVFEFRRKREDTEY